MRLHNVRGSDQQGGLLSTCRSLESLETIRPVAWPSVSPYMCNASCLIRPMARPSVSPYSQEYFSPKSKRALKPIVPHMANLVSEDTMATRIQLPAL